MGTKYRQIVEALPDFLDIPIELKKWADRIQLQLGQVEEWHEVGTSGEPAFQNSWTNDTSSYPTAAFYKDPMGRVHLKGQVTGGVSGNSAFVLPVGYRPSTLLVFPAYNFSGNTIARIYVTSVGTVQPLFTGTAPQRIPLNGVSFRAEQ